MHAETKRGYLIELYILLQSWYKCSFSITHERICYSPIFLELYQNSVLHQRCIFCSTFIFLDLLLRTMILSWRNKDSCSTNFLYSFEYKKYLCFKILNWFHWWVTWYCEKRDKVNHSSSRSGKKLYAQCMSVLN